MFESKTIHRKVVVVVVVVMLVIIASTQSYINININIIKSYVLTESVLIQSQATVRKRHATR